jgi:hypothetical protein
MAATPQRVPSSQRVRGGRPFWMHQLVEYIFGAVLVAQGLQSPSPVLPAVAGGVVMVNAAMVRGPLAAFRVTSRAVHRVADLVVMGAIVAAAVQPWIAVDAGARLVMLGVTVALAFVWWQTNFAEKAPRAGGAIGAEGGRSTEVGRLAGRAVGDGINIAKRLRKR